MYLQVPRWLRQSCGKGVDDYDNALAGRTADLHRLEGCAGGDGL